MPGFQSFFRFSHHFELAKLATSSVWVKISDVFLRSVSDLSVAWAGVQTVMVLLIQLCQRNSGKIDESEREVCRPIYYKRAQRF